MLASHGFVASIGRDDPQAIGLHSPQSNAYARAYARARALIPMVFVLVALAALAFVPAAGAHARAGRHPAVHHSLPRHHAPSYPHPRPPYPPHLPQPPHPPHPMPPPPRPHPIYLALGDSLAFGYSEAKFDSLLPEEPVSAYETGYVNDFAKVLGLFEPGVQIVNDGCPGETTESFIKGPCAYGQKFPLHHPYSGSQLADALAVIAAAHPGEVSPITLDIGANDALGVIEETCKSEAKCVEEHAPALFGEVIGNLGYILSQLRAAAPHAQIIVLGLYNPFGESIAGADALTAKLNELEASTAAGVGARFADPLPVFNPPGALEQPVLCTLTNICTPLKDIHPTDLGYAVLGGVILQQYLAF